MRARVLVLFMLALGFAGMGSGRCDRGTVDVYNYSSHDVYVKVGCHDGGYLMAGQGDEYEAALGEVDVVVETREGRKAYKTVRISEYYPNNSWIFYDDDFW